MHERCRDEHSTVAIAGQLKLADALEPPQVGHDLHDLVAGLHDLRVELERPLRGDQVDQLLHRLDVRRFQRALPNIAVAVVARVAGRSASPEASVC